MRIARIIIGGLISPITNISNTDQRSAIPKTAVRPLTYGIAELVAQFGRIDQIISISDFTDTARLKKSMSFKTGSARHRRTGQNHDRFPLHGNHIFIEPDTVTGIDFQSAQIHDQFHPSRKRCKACIHINASVIVNEHARIEQVHLSLFLSVRRTVRPLYITVKFIFSRRRITHGNGSYRQTVKFVIQIIPAVCSLYHIRRAHVHISLSVFRILACTVNDAFIPPIGQVTDRSRPAYIIIYAEIRPVEPIVASVHIYPFSEYSRFTVGNVFEAWQIWIICLF